MGWEQPRFSPGFISLCFLFKSWYCHKDKDTRNFMSSIIAKERGNGLGLINGKQDKERDKVAEVELPTKYLAIFGALHFFVSDKNQYEYS